MQAMLNFAPRNRKTMGTHTRYARARTHNWFQKRGAQKKGAAFAAPFVYFYYFFCVPFSHVAQNAAMQDFRSAAGTAVVSPRPAATTVDFSSLLKKS